MFNHSNQCYFCNCCLNKT